jgi:hypothetical protein
MSIAIVILLVLILFMQARSLWVQGEHTVVLDLTHDKLDGVDFDVRDIHQVTGAQRAPYREALRERRMRGGR